MHRLGCAVQAYRDHLAAARWQDATSGGQREDGVTDLTWVVRILNKSIEAPAQALTPRIVKLERELRCGSAEVEAAGAENQFALRRRGRRQRAAFCRLNGGESVDEPGSAVTDQKVGAILTVASLSRAWPGRGFENRFNIGLRERGVNGFQKRSYPGHMRRGHRCALQEVPVKASTDIIVDRTQDTVRIGVVVGIGTDVAPRCHHVELAPEVRVGRALPPKVHSADSEHCVAAGRRQFAGILIAVSRRDHNDDAATYNLVEKRLFHSVASPAPAQTQVDNVGRIGIGGHTLNAKPCRPSNTVHDVAQGAAAFGSQHANRQNLRRPVDTGHPDTVVAIGRNDARYMTTVGAVRLKSAPAVGVSILAVVVPGGVSVGDIVVAR